MRVPSLDYKSLKRPKIRSELASRWVHARPRVHVTEVCEPPKNAAPVKDARLSNRERIKGSYPAVVIVLFGLLFPLFVSADKCPIFSVKCVQYCQILEDLYPWIWVMMPEASRLQKLGMSYCCVLRGIPLVFAHFCNRNVRSLSLAIIKKLSCIHSADSSKEYDQQQSK